MSACISLSGTTRFHIQSCLHMMRSNEAWTSADMTHRVEYFRVWCWRIGWYTRSGFAGITATKTVCGLQALMTNWIILLRCKVFFCQTLICMAPALYLILLLVPLCSRLYLCVDTFISKVQDSPSKPALRRKHLHWNKPRQVPHLPGNSMHNKCTQRFTLCIHTLSTCMYTYIYIYIYVYMLYKRECVVISIATSSVSLGNDGLV